MSMEPDTCGFHRTARPWNIWIDTSLDAHILSFHVLHCTCQGVQLSKQRRPLAYAADDGRAPFVGAALIGAREEGPSHPAGAAAGAAGEMVG